MFGESWKNLAAFRLQNIAWLSPNTSAAGILERCMILPPTVLTVALPTLLAFNGLLGRTAFAADEARLLDLDGRAANPFKCKAKLIAFIFVRTDCPISNSYAPEIRRLDERFAKDGAAFWLVYPSEDELPAAIRRHLSEFSFPCGALRDPRHVFAQRSKVQVTPEAAIFRPDGTLVYSGRIDDRYADFGKAKPEATRHELAEALALALEGKLAPPAAGPAIGCFIEDVK